MKSKEWFGALIAVAGTELVGAIGTVFTRPEIGGWYQELQKPALNPPNWVFGPVWTTLFALMGIAAYLVWRQGWERKQVKVAIGFFVGQMALNVLWSMLFFGLQDPGAAFVEIIMLGVAIVATIAAFARVSKLAAWLLVPYILWVSFAAYLNYAIWQLN